MKPALIVALSSIAISSVACQSGEIGKRTDYSDSAFDPTKPQIAERAKYLRALDPALSEQEAIARASQDLAAERKAERKKLKAREQQDKFESDLAKSVEK